MVEELSGISLDLDIVADIVPMENLRLAMYGSKGILLVGTFSLLSGDRGPVSSVCLLLVVFRRFHDRRNVPTTEHEDFALGSRTLDRVRCQHVRRREKDPEGNDDAQIPEKNELVKLS